MKLRAGRDPVILTDAAIGRAIRTTKKRPTNVSSMAADVIQVISNSIDSNDFAMVKYSSIRNVGKCITGISEKKMGNIDAGITDVDDLTRSIKA
jgi:hypothetical protein